LGTLFRPEGGPGLRRRASTAGRQSNRNADQRFNGASVAGALLNTQPLQSTLSAAAPGIGAAAVPLGLLMAGSSRSPGMQMIGSGIAGLASRATFYRT